MLTPETIYLWKELLQAQAQAASACQNYSGECPVDTRYQLEWEALRDHLDVVVYNLSADLTALDAGLPSTFTEGEIRARIAYVLEETVPTAMLLLNGYVYDLAYCDEADHPGCKLKERARHFLDQHTNA